MPARLAEARQDLVAANHILSNEGILDAYGHVSIRHPEHPNRYILAWSRSPELVQEQDLIEFALDGTPLEDTDQVLYIERHIHGAVYEARPDVTAVCHSHDLAILPFSISAETRLQPVIHSAANLGGDVPVWNIADEFGAGTDLLVRNMDQGRSLGRTLGSGAAALMRGHGCVVAGIDLLQVVGLCISLDKNARVQMEAMRMGSFIGLSSGEIAAHRGLLASPTRYRAWEYWKRRAGS